MEISGNSVSNSIGGTLLICSECGAKGRYSYAWGSGSLCSACWTKKVTQGPPPQKAIFIDHSSGAQFAGGAEISLSFKKSEGPCGECGEEMDVGIKITHPCKFVAENEKLHLHCYIDRCTQKALERLSR